MESMLCILDRALIIANVQASLEQIGFFVISINNSNLFICPDLIGMLFFFAGTRLGVWNSTPRMGKGWLDGIRDRIDDISICFGINNITNNSIRIIQLKSTFVTAREVKWSQAHAKQQVQFHSTRSMLNLCGFIFTGYEYL